MKRRAGNPSGAQEEVMLFCFSPADLRRPQGHGRLMRHKTVILFALIAGLSLPCPNARSDDPIWVWGGDFISLGNPNAVRPAGLSNIVDIAACDTNCMALRADGRVLVWGDNSYGQKNVPTDLAGVMAIAGGGTHCLALQSNGTVVAWGNSANGRTSVPAGLAGVVAISAGSAHSLALKSDGRVVAWGSNAYGQTNVPRGLSNVVAVAAGGFHSLALIASGGLVAWGSNDFGQTNVPWSKGPFLTIAAGYKHSLAVNVYGNVIAWGYNGYGQTDAPFLADAIGIAAGRTFSVALKSDYSTVAWGEAFIAPNGLTNCARMAGGAAHAICLFRDDFSWRRVLSATPIKAGTNFSLVVPSRSGRVYSLDVKTSFVFPTWTPVVLGAGNGGTLVLTDVSATSKSRFYRVREW